ncbi:MAG TPA: DNA polymerase [Candidatus Sulfotelmatobacter sp.]
MAAVSVFLDFETRSAVDLKARGLENYSKAAEVLMLGYAFNEQPPQIWLPHKEPLPEQLAVVLTRPEILKVAFNAEFERLIFKECLGIDIPINQWCDPSVMAKYASISGSLDYVGAVLGIAEDKAKLASGKKLIRKFSVPKKDGTYDDWNSHPDEFSDFIIYCLRDVAAEREIFHKLKAFHPPKFEEEILTLTLEMNSTGVPIDRLFLEKASQIVEIEQARLSDEMRALTGISNANSPKQVMEYLHTQGYTYHSIGKKFIAKAKKEIAITAAGKRCLELRELLAKSSTSKLKSLANFIGPDGYLRNTFVYYGAPRSGRWSARGPQLQNFPRGGIKNKYEEAVEAIRNYPGGGMSTLADIKQFGSPLDVVSSCLRSALRAPEGSRFVVCDLSNIDSRTLAWLAGCRPILDVYHAGIDLYTTYGVEFFGRTYDDLRHDKERRSISKVCVLSCGYGLGGGKEEVVKGDTVRTGLWKITSDADIDLPQEDCHRAVKLFRDMYPEIPALWRRVEAAVIAAIRTGGNQKVECLTFGCVKPGRLLWIQLPSGRKLFFVRPQLETEEMWDGRQRMKVTYEDNVIGTTRGRVKGYGGSFVGIITQAVARDIFAHGLLRARAAGFRFGALIHDEGVCCESDPRLTHELLAKCMTEHPPWTDVDLPLAAESFESVFYRKG